MKITICIASVLTVSLTTLPSLHAQAANSQVERGQYLVAIMGCHDCHSPKLPGTMKPDPASLLSGRPQATKLPSTTPGEMHASEDFTAFTGGWGSTVASNLTPDQATGLGMRYTEEKFVKAMREGKKPEGIAMMPPMPVDVYANVKDEDLKAIFAYLKTVKPVRNAVRAGLTPEKK